MCPSIRHDQSLCFVLVPILMGHADQRNIQTLLLSYELCSTVHAWYERPSIPSGQWPFHTHDDSSDIHSQHHAGCAPASHSEGVHVCAQGYAVTLCAVDQDLFTSIYA
ncbi:hypothetical protein BC826DRAFT_1014857 [Russula brevipes]|nr:hypothetical protein BC826DRAFT_1014857 [Russula brevipes]